MSDQLPKPGPKAVACSELLGWLRGKLTDAEKAVRAREQEEQTWRGGTAESWRAAGCRLNKAQRIELADIAGRILVKCRREVENYKAVIEILGHPNDQAQRPGLMAGVERKETKGKTNE